MKILKLITLSCILAVASANVFAVKYQILASKLPVSNMLVPQFQFLSSFVDKMGAEHIFMQKVDNKKITGSIGFLMNDNFKGQVVINGDKEMSPAQDSHVVFETTDKELIDSIWYMIKMSMNQTAAKKYHFTNHNCGTAVRNACNDCGLASYPFDSSNLGLGTSQKIESSDQGVDCKTM